MAELVRCGCKADVISFTDFLKENNAYDDYMNTLTYTCMDIMVEPKNWINFAFYWADTVEGYDYWNELNKKWLEKISRVRKEIKW